MKRIKLLSIAALVTSMLLGSCDSSSPTSSTKPIVPTSNPTSAPTSLPTSEPTSTPTSESTSVPTSVPTSEPTSKPTSMPTTSVPTTTSAPTSESTSNPTSGPTSTPTTVPTSESTSVPTSVTTSESTSASTTVPSEKLKTTIQIELKGSLHAEKTYDLSFDYDDDFFNRNAKEYDKEISLLSFGAAMSTGSFDDIESYFEQAQFNAITGNGYDGAPTVDTAGYTFAYKNIDDFSVIAVIFRGLNYGAEWANNFLMGESGDHEGFLTRSTEAYNKLLTYVNENCPNKTIKLWISGYSRGGALANVASSLILRNEDFTIRQEDMFVYTFEAPYCLSKDNAVAYENVHNIINSNDLVTNIPPFCYDFARCGVDYPIYDENISALAKEFDDGLIIPEFVEISAASDLKNDADLKSFIISTVFQSNLPPEEWSCLNRSEYVDRYQTGLSYLVGIVFSLSNTSRTNLINSLSAMGAMDFLTLLADETGKAIADLLKPYLDSDQISYDYDVLVSNSAVLRNAIYYLLLQALLIYVNESYRPSLIRLIDMHYPESVYVLLVNAHQNAN